MKRLMVCIFFWVWVLEVFGGEHPTLKIVDPDLQEWYQSCSQTPGCKIILREFRILDSDKTWLTEPMLIIRTPQTISMSLARIKGAKQNYLVLFIPDATIDTALIKLLGGK
jgi:hypothetical protein